MATVLRAISILVSLRIPTILLSLKGFFGFSFSMICRIFSWTLAEANGFPVEAVDGAVKEEFQLEKALRRVSVFIGGHPADGGLVHADVLGHVPEHHGFQMRDPFFEKGLLKAEDALHDPVDGFLALMDASDQPRGRPDLLLKVFPFLFSNGLPPAEGVAVIGVDSESRHSVVVEYDDEFPVHFVDEDVGDDVSGFFLAELATRLGFQTLDDPDRRKDVLQFHFQGLGDDLVILVFQVGEMLPNNGRDDGVFQPQVRGLDEQGFLEVSGADARRIEGLHAGKDFRDFFFGRTAHPNQVFQADVKVAVPVQVADDEAADLVRLPGKEKSLTVATGGGLSGSSFGRRRLRNWASPFFLLRNET